MTILPTTVKRRDSSGVTGREVRCDSIVKALEVAAEFRLKGFADVWFEDVDGRPVDEKLLQSSTDRTLL